MHLKSSHDAVIFVKVKVARKYSYITELKEMQTTAYCLEDALLVFAKYLPKTVVRVLLRNNSFHRLGHLTCDFYLLLCCCCC